MFLIAGSLYAATLPGAIGDDYRSPMNLERVTVGVNYEYIDRIVEVKNNGVTDLKANSYSLFLGVDLNHWFTVFGTLGQSESNQDVSGPAGADDWENKWSLGVNANLWQWSIRAPRGGLGDRVTIRAFAEYADYKVNEAFGSTDWSDLVIALPIAYEMFEDNVRVKDDELFRLAIFAGPMLSHVDGSVESSGMCIDFEEGDSLGLVAGIDIYFTKHITLGAQAQLYEIDGEDVSGRASLRYHF